MTAHQLHRDNVHTPTTTCRKGKEIDTLERADIITKSISPWASPVVIVPKKGAPGKALQRRMCVDFRRLNGLQPEVRNMSGGKGCISLVPLPKID